MYAQRFEPIADRCHEIVEYIMASPDMPQADDLLFKIRLATEEAVENIVCYAYENGAGYLEVGTERDGNVLTIRYKDSGRQFDPLNKPDPDLSLSAEDRPIGGLGIFLCKQMMDELYYEYKDGCNILTMKKKIS